MPAQRRGPRAHVVALILASLVVAGCSDEQFQPDEGPAEATSCDTVLLPRPKASSDCVTGAPSPTPTPTRPVVFGAVGGSDEELRDHDRALGRPMDGVRVFRTWDAPTFTATEFRSRRQGRVLFVSIRAKRATGEYSRSATSPPPSPARLSTTTCRGRQRRSEPSAHRCS